MIGYIFLENKDEFQGCSSFWGWNTHVHFMKILEVITNLSTIDQRAKQTQTPSERRQYQVPGTRHQVPAGTIIPFISVKGDTKKDEKTLK